MSMQKKTICVVGLGYIGLPTASLLGTKGYRVHGVDVSADVVEIVNQGGIHILEPGLDIIVKSAVQSGNLKASTVPCEADVFIIAVPTPLVEKTDGGHVSGKRPDLSFIENATRDISRYLRPGNLVILESTSPVGTTEEVVAKILREQGHNVDREIFIAHCPERVLPGQILLELVANDRVVGGVNEKSTELAVEFYKEFVQGEVIPTTAKTAEMVKLTENSSRDVQIAFANEISMICESEKINTWEVIEIANRHPRVNILQPGPGVGGHCIAVDPWFIVHRVPEISKLIRTAREVNDSKPAWVIKRVEMCAVKFKNPVIACLGIAFKADVDDLRESPALDIARHLKESNIGEVIVCEPTIIEHKEFELTDMEQAIARADIVLILVDHKEFKSIKAADMNEKLLIDTRGIIK